MRISISFWALAAACAGSAPCRAAPAMTTGTCPEITRSAAVPAPERKANALGLLGSVTQLLSPLGKPVLTSNFATTVAISNEAPPPLRAQALSDALITNENANTVADGLGATMAAIYRAKAIYSSPDDGAHPHCGQIGAAVTAVINAVNVVSAEDSGAGKSSYADAKKKSFSLPPSGTYDDLGKAYDHEAGTLGAGSLGNSRPFQTAPIWASSGPSIKTYDGTDFFGVASNSRLLLMGATAADTAEGRTGSDLTNSPSFPSGHTTFGYTEALILAMMVPERFRALAYRGSEYGHSRIVIGAHYAVDVIGGRTLATYDLAQDLAGRPGYAQVPGHTFRAAVAAAAAELRTYLQQNGCPAIAACASRDPIARADEASVFAGGMPTAATVKEAYAFRLTYGLAAMGSTARPQEPVPAEAATLLETRFPYLTAAQRLDVLRTTEGPSGYFLDVSPIDGRPLAGGSGAAGEAGAYSRLDLYAAAGGYATFTDQIVIDQDASSIADPDLSPFLDLTRADTWSNDIGGVGGLTKVGTGTLTLAGTNTYTGPTIIGGGTLEIAGSITSATKVEGGGTLAGRGKTGDVTVAAGGTLAPGAAVGNGTLEIGGSLALNPGALYVAHIGASSPSQARIAGGAKLDGARLTVKTGSRMPVGAHAMILTAGGGISGKFASVVLDTPALVPRLTYTSDAVYLMLEEKSVAPAN